MSRGFAFVRFYRVRDAADAVDQLDGKLVYLGCESVVLGIFVYVTA